MSESAVGGLLRESRGTLSQLPNQSTSAPARCLTGKLHSEHLYGERKTAFTTLGHLIVDMSAFTYSQDRAGHDERYQ